MAEGNSFIFPAIDVPIPVALKPGAVASDNAEFAVVSKMLAVDLGRSIINHHA